MRCYICNKELVDNPVGDDLCQTHGEHIIHNGIRGKLISSQILCKDCGDDYSKDDSVFCKIFAPFMVALKDQLIPADHGKDTYKTLPGSLFDSPTSDLDIFIREYGIDMSLCSVTSYEDQLRYVQECIRKYPPQTYDLQDALKNASAKLQSLLMAALCKQKVSEELDNMLDELLGSAYGKNVVAQVEKQVAELTKNMNFADAMQTVNAFTESAKLEYYRKFGFDVIDGEATNFSIPDYSMKFLVEHKDVVEVCTNAKFSHLSCLRYKPETLA